MMVPAILLVSPFIRSMSRAQVRKVQIAKSVAKSPGPIPKYADGAIAAAINAVANIMLRIVNFMCSC